MMSSDGHGGIDTVQLARAEMARHYDPLRLRNFPSGGFLSPEHRAIWSAMDCYAAANPDCSPVLLKARLHEEIAAQFQPVLFPHSPFFFEMGLRYSENWGNCHALVVGSWLEQRNRGRCYDPATSHSREITHFGFRPGALAIAKHDNVFDYDHHCLGYTHLLRVGVKGVVREIEARRGQPTSPAQGAFLEAARRSCLALLGIAARFAESAREQSRDAPDSASAEFMRMAAEAAGRVPANPPETFYEGLAALWFLREVTATVEGVGVSVVGHLDRLLIDLYRADLAAGRITEARARELLALWMLPTDVKFHVEDHTWPETSTCMELGGCDEDGVLIFNELTRLILEVHRDRHFLNPKPNCRISSQSSEEYLELLSGMILAGHNVFALLNDDTLIPACVKAGKNVREARLYVNGGCQETIVEGVEHSAGAYYYFNLPRVLDLCLQPPQELPPPLFSETAAERVPGIADAADFEGFYQHVVSALKDTIAAGAEWRRKGGLLWREVNPCPFFSSTLTGCIANADDYTTGSASYNPAGLALVGFGTLVDSLHAIRSAVYEQSWLPLRQLRDVLAGNWQGEEALRRRIIALPKFGHGDAEVDALASRIARELAEFARTCLNERGGVFQPSFFVYYAFKTMGDRVRATPDGRRDGELLSQGVAPGRLRPSRSLTNVLRSVAKVDFSEYPGNAVVDVQLPLGEGMSARQLVAILRSFIKLGGPTLQFNCVSIDKLKEAQENPDEHRDLIVRISGLSAYFTCLTKDVQDEIICRTVMS